MKEIEGLLRKLRGRLAYAKQCKPYKIFRDIELNLLLENKPKTIEELACLKGFPKDGKRVTCWGESIIKIFNKPGDLKDFAVTLDGEGFPVSVPILKKMDLF